MHLPLLQNFVGLSVSDGYIATGSETNEVFHMSISFSFSVNFCSTTEVKCSVWIRCSYTTRPFPCQHCHSSFRTQTLFPGMKSMMPCSLSLRYVGAASPPPCLLQIPQGMSRFWRWLEFCIYSAICRRYKVLLPSAIYKGVYKFLWLLLVSYNITNFCFRS